MNDSKDCAQHTNIGPERNHYFDGKMLTSHDFRDEQSYLMGRRNLHNRLMHGYGVVCGLKVEQHPGSDRKKRSLLVTPGVAIDGCGREIILREAVTTAVRADQLDSRVICVRYCEEPAQFIPVVGDPDDTDKKEANRIREVADIVIKPLDEMDPSCWQASENPCILDDKCPCAGLVPLAAVFYANPGEPNGALRLDFSYRRQLVGGIAQHTRIDWVNWPHGGELTLHQIRSQLSRQLMVRFSDELQPSVPGSGISNFTFQVQALDQYLAPEFTIPGRARLLDDRRTAIYTLSNRLFDGQYDLNGLQIAVNVKCDFILDHDGNAVDGNHLRGRLPSGNGSAGGDFYSWFRIAG